MGSKGIGVGSVLGCGRRKEEMWGKVWGHMLERGVGGVKKSGERCGREYGVSVEGVEKCVGMWKETRKDMGRGVGKCVGVWGTL